MSLSAGFVLVFFLVSFCLFVHVCLFFLALTACQHWSADRDFDIENEDLDIENACDLEPMLSLRFTPVREKGVIKACGSCSMKTFFTKACILCSFASCIYCPSICNFCVISFECWQTENGMLLVLMTIFS